MDSEITSLNSFIIGSIKAEWKAPLTFKGMRRRTPLVLANSAASAKASTALLIPWIS